MLKSEDFINLRVEEFNGLDADGNGTLELDELFPLIEAIGSVHPFSITYDHCQQFMELFDENGDGVLQLEEYINLVTYVVALACLKHKSDADAAPKNESEFEAENKQLKSVLDRAVQENMELKRML